MRCCQSTNEEAIETVNDSEGNYSDADQEGSCSTQKKVVLAKKDLRKGRLAVMMLPNMLLGTNLSGRQNFHGYYLRKNSMGVVTGMLC